MVLSLPKGRFVGLVDVRIVLWFYIVLVFCHSNLGFVVHISGDDFFAHLYIFITFTPFCFTNIDLSPVKIYPNSGVFLCTCVKVNCLRFLVCSQIFE